MVSTDSSTEGSSMDEREKKFYSRPIGPRQPPSSSPSESLSKSDSSEHASSLPQKKIPGKADSTPSKQASSSGKRPRNEDDEPSTKKSRKGKNSNGDKRKGKNQSPLSSPQKSAKKPSVWNPKDEVSFLKGVAAYCQDGKVFPKNALTPVYDYVRSLNMLGQEFNNVQLGEKFRRLRSRFLGMNDKVKVGGYSFKNAHEENLYRLSKKIWGKEEDAEESEDEDSESSEELPVKEEEVGNGAKEDGLSKKDVEDEEEGEEEEEEEEEDDVKEEDVVKEEGDKSTGEDVEMTPKENDEVEEEEDEEDETKENVALFGIPNHAAVKEEVITTLNGVSNGTISNGDQDDIVGKLNDLIRKEMSVARNEFRVQWNGEKEDIKNAIQKMVRESFRSFLNGETSNGIGFSSEEMARKIYSARDLPALDDSEERMLDQKWERQLLTELEACSGHLALLQEECRIRMERIRSVVNEKNR